MKSTLHIGVLPPPDLKSLFSPAPHPLLPSANWLSYSSLTFRNTHLQALFKDSVARGIFSLAASSLGSSASAGL